MLTKEACKVLGVTLNTLFSYYRKGFISRKPYKNTFDYNNEDIKKIIEYKERSNSKYFSGFEKRTSWNKGKKFSKLSRKKMSNSRKKFFRENPERLKECGLSSKLTISKIKKRYSFFSKIEEMRYNLDKDGEIQVHCKNHLCKNSKEQNGWFTPTYIQLYERIRALERPLRMIENNFYCSEECKTICPLYGVQSDPFKEDSNYTQQEYETFRQEVLRRQKEEHGYNFCEKCESIENLHVHHEKPQKTNPIMTLDPDNGIVFCKGCHYKKIHIDDCSMSNLANIC